MEIKQAAVPIIPSNDLDATQAFYERLGFGLTSNYTAHGYRIMHNAAGASVHLTRTEPGWVDPERNAQGIYLYSEDIEELAAKFGCRAAARPGGRREIGVSDTNGTLVRVGWPN